MSNALTKTFDKKAENNQLKKVIPWVDIYENDDEILVHADMPGVKKEDVTVNVDNGTLAISGIRRMPDKGQSCLAGVYRFGICTQIRRAPVY